MSTDETKIVTMKINCKEEKSRIVRPLNVPYRVLEPQELLSIAEPFGCVFEAYVPSKTTLFSYPMGYHLIVPLKERTLALTSTGKLTSFIGVTIHGMGAVRANARLLLLI